MKKKKNSSSTGVNQVVFGAVKTYLAGNALKLVSFVLMFVLMSMLSFVRVATTNTIFSFNMFLWKKENVLSARGFPLLRKLMPR